MQEETSTLSVTESIKCEEQLWKLVTECVNADYVYFESKNDREVPEEDRTPLTLLNKIITEDHLLLSTYYIIKWLERVMCLV